MRDAFELAANAADELRARSGVDAYDVAVILSSGWSEGASALGPPSSVISTSSLPGFAEPMVEGHHGQILSVTVGDRRVVLVAGRIHLYEGHSVAAVVHSVRTVVAAGARRVVLTNACGGIDPTIVPGSVVVIRDQINLTGASPLEGPAPPDGYASRFVDLSDLYSARLRALVHAGAPELTEGVYAGFRGPHYETPTEVAMARTMGATLVGMSTVLEAIAARHLGAEVLGFGFVSNFAAGVSTRPLAHSEVLEAGESASASLGELLGRVIPTL